MKWEDSRALTPLKMEFLNAFFAEIQDFFLTGGTALSVFYLQHRRSYDLDFVSLRNVDWGQLRTTLFAIAQHLDADLTSITQAPFFHRYELTRGGERELLDFVTESVPQIDERLTALIVALNRPCCYTSALIRCRRPGSLRDPPEMDG